MIDFLEIIRALETACTNLEKVANQKENQTIIGLP